MKEGFEEKLLDVLERINANLVIIARKKVTYDCGTEVNVNG